MARWTLAQRTTRRKRGRWLVRLRRSASLVGLALLIGVLAATLKSLVADPHQPSAPNEAVFEAMATLQQELNEARGNATVLELKLERATSVIEYSSQYHIPADLAGGIYDAALSEGIHPALGFQLVKVESGFRAGAVSNKGAIGYAQVRLPTAQVYEPDITAEGLQDRDTNLRIGFRFLKDLMERFDNDLRVALLAYNRGPTRVAEILQAGGDPANGYSRAVLKGVPTVPSKMGS